MNIPALDLTADHVARAHREVPDPGPNPLYTRLEDAEVEAVAAGLLAQRPPGPLYVFAYGSLLWKPEVTPADQFRATAPGWHRQFCIELTAWRGTPEAPGLMMALMSGGSCAGLALELPEDGVAASLAALVRREMPYREMLGNVRWTRLDTARGQLRALVFYAGPRGPRIRRGLDLAEAARLMARACGHGGSSAEYLHRTVASLGAHGIHDRNLWALQRLVAAEIDRL